MKRILLACFLLTATCTATMYVQTATAQTADAPVTRTDFVAKANQMDAYIAAGNLTAAQSTWDEVHQMMIKVLATTKKSIATSATPADKASYTTIMQNQRALYDSAWNLKDDLSGNRTALHNKLIEFSNTIY